MKTQTTMKELYEQKCHQYEKEQMVDDVIRKLNSEDPEQLMTQFEPSRNDDNWFFRIGKAYSALNNSVAAINAFREAYSINPLCDAYNHFLGLEYLKLGQKALALKAFNKGTSYDASLTEIAGIYLQSGDIDNAEYYLKIVDKMSIRSKKNNYLLSQIFAAKGNYYDAMRYIDLALDVI